jgi:hypothetical protein
MPKGIYNRSEKEKNRLRNLNIGRTPWNKDKKTGLIPKSAFKKGHKLNEGRKFSEKHKENLSIAKLGNKNALGHRKSEITKEKQSIKMQGRHLNTETEFKVGQFQGNKHHNWKGGISSEEYDQEFDKDLKERIRKKYNYRCQECFREQVELYDKNGRKYKLIIHHIDYNKKNNQENNLIPLCRSCHAQTLYNRNDWIKHYQKKII